MFNFFLYVKTVLKFTTFVLSCLETIVTLKQGDIKNLLQFGLKYLGPNGYYTLEIFYTWYTP